MRIISLQILIKTFFHCKAFDTLIFTGSTFCLHAFMLTSSLISSSLLSHLCFQLLPIGVRLSCSSYFADTAVIMFRFTEHNKDQRVRLNSIWILNPPHQTVNLLIYTQLLLLWLFLLSADWQVETRICVLTSDPSWWLSVTTATATDQYPFNSEVRGGW